MEKQRIIGADGTTVFMEMVRDQLKKGVPGFETEIREEAPDNFGIHWRGWRALIRSGNVQMYIHTGLVYHPDTRAGIYTEIDSGNNEEIFEAAWEYIKPSMEYDLSKEEPDYLKFFYPSCKWDELMEADTAKEQADLWRQYFECVLLGLAAALKTTEKVERKKTEVRLKENSVVKAEKLFAFTIQDLNNIYRMTKEFTDALQETGQQEYSTVIHKKAADRYGIYSAGARLFAHGSSSGKNLYLWCGLLFTDKKKSGLIIEADRYSNQDTFDVLLKNIPESAGYEVERSNGFIKLFLPEKAFRAIKEANPDKKGKFQERQILDFFIRDCLTAFLEVPGIKRAGIPELSVTDNAPAESGLIYAAARAVAGTVNVRYAELVATFSQLPEHKDDLSDPQAWMRTARDKIKRAAGCKFSKAILSVNPSVVQAADRYTLYLECIEEPKMEKVSAAVEETLKPGTGYVLKMPPVYDGQKITIMLETTERCCEN